MHVRTMSYGLLLLSINVGQSAEFPSSLYGVALGSNLAALQGDVHRQIGKVTIQGVKTVRYVLDPKHYPVTAPFTDLMVQVQENSGQIVSISALAEMSINDCSAAAAALQERVANDWAIQFKVLTHQGNDFYLYQTDDSFVSVGCQTKSKTHLQHQIGSFSLK